MRTLLTTLTAATLTLALLGAGVSFAEASSKYSVTITASATQLQLGHTFTLKGSVSPGAKGKTVSIQRKYGAGSWATIGHATLSTTSKYAKVIKPSKAAVTSYRVVKGSSSSHSAGTSSTKVVTVSRWRHLTDLPQFEHTLGAEQSNSATIKGHVYPHSVRASNNASITYTLGKACTGFTSVVGMDDSSVAGATGTATAFVTYDTHGGTLFGSHAVAVGEYGTYITKETSLTGVIYLELSGSSSSNAKIVVYGTPQVYCAS
ncbi:MAG: hypothetical protein JWR83_3265 [Aeromicrobium sp.]|nr:hypothetical protein [Aeromicrobium sp.]